MSYFDMQVLKAICDSHFHVNVRKHWALSKKFYFSFGVVFSFIIGKMHKHFICISCKILTKYVEKEVFMNNFITFFSYEETTICILKQQV